MDIADIIVKLGFGAVIYILALMLIKSISTYFKKRAHFGRGHSASIKLAETVQKEKRQHPRVNITWPVSIQVSQGTIEAETKNISLSGAFICCHEPLPLRENFHLTIDSPNHDPLTLEAEVVWSNINVPDEKIVNRGMGIRFIQITEDDRGFLSEMISAHLD